MLKHSNPKKRLFLGAEIMASWPHELPKGRIINEHTRHITLAFLGNTSWPELEKILPFLPKPPFSIGLVGKADKYIFLPEKTPRVVAAHVEWLTEKNSLSHFQMDLTDWLGAHEYKTDKRDFLPHITLARAPLDLEKWKETFFPFPLFVKALHCYESLGNLTYHSLWTYPLLPPFEELDHTADIAFHIKGKDLEQLHLHALVALAFKFPPLLSFFSTDVALNSLDDIIIDLNSVVAKADMAIGSPFKAISFHGNITQDENQCLQWEMIVDV